MREENNENPQEKRFFDEECELKEENIKMREEPDDSEMEDLDTAQLDTAQEWELESGESSFHGEAAHLS